MKPPLAPKEGAGGPKIEITEEMIEAGLEALRAEPFVDLLLSEARNLVVDIIIRTSKVHGNGKSQAL